MFTERVSQLAFAVVVESSMSSYLGLHFKQLFSGTIRVSVASGFSFGVLTAVDGAYLSSQAAPVVCSD